MRASEQGAGADKQLTRAYEQSLAYVPSFIAVQLIPFTQILISLVHFLYDKFETLSHTGAVLSIQDAVFA